MALNWSSVTKEHLAQACDLLAKGENLPRVGAKGIFILYKDQRLPAKHVARLAYCLANGLPLHTAVKFSSGEGLISLLQKRGHLVVRSSIQ